MRVVDAINAAMHEFLGSNPDAFFIGEDVLDPYGGAFKVAKGLSTAYPSQVITTPISEAGIAGLATGLAIKSRPVCLEIMFGDFITLSADQIINHMTKLPWVYNNQIAIPVVIRTPMGGRRGYGSTHSQSLEKHFCGVPGLSVRAVSQYTNIVGLYREVFAARTPHLVIENKAIYAKNLKTNSFANIASPDLVIISYGGCMEDCVMAATLLAEVHEIRVKVVEIDSLWPFDYLGIRAALDRARAVLTVEEGTTGWGFAAEVARSLVGVDNIFFDSIAAPDHPIPSAKVWEDRILSSCEKVVTRSLQLLRRTI
jgi:pyruvate/2-oxoglutarate/acetoin dehydrogenase E1 component